MRRGSGRIPVGDRSDHRPQSAGYIGCSRSKHPDDAVGTKIEVAADQRLDPLVGDAPGAEGGDGDRGRLGHADRVGELNLAALGEAGRHDVLGHVARGVCRRAIHLGGSLPERGAAAMAGPAAVGIDDDLAPGEATIPHRSPDHELAGGGTDVVAGLGAHPLARQDGVDDVAAHPRSTRSS